MCFEAQDTHSLRGLYNFISIIQVVLGINGNHGLCPHLQQLSCGWEVFLFCSTREYWSILEKEEEQLNFMAQFQKGDFWQRRSFHAFTPADAGAHIPCLPFRSYCQFLTQSKLQSGVKALSALEKEWSVFSSHALQIKHTLKLSGDVSVWQLTCPSLGLLSAGSAPWEGNAATSSTFAKTEAAILTSLLAQCWLLDLHRSNWAGLERSLLCFNRSGQPQLTLAVIGREELSWAWCERAITHRWGRVLVMTYAGYVSPDTDQQADIAWEEDMVQGLLSTLGN